MRGLDFLDLCWLCHRDWLCASWGSKLDRRATAWFHCWAHCAQGSLDIVLAGSETCMQWMGCSLTGRQRMAHKLYARNGLFTNVCTTKGSQTCTQWMGCSQHVYSETHTNRNTLKGPGALSLSLSFFMLIDGMGYPMSALSSFVFFFCVQSPSCSCPCH